MHDSAPPIGAFDAFRDVKNWDAEKANYWTGVLNQRSAEPDQIALRDFILNQSGLKPAETVLEIGCGTGRLLFELTKAVGPEGRAIGIEPQTILAKEAEGFILDQTQSTIARVLCGVAEDIPLSDKSIDVCVAQTVLIHIPPGKLNQVFSEIKRVLKPNGRFVTVDQDGDTWIIDHPDRKITREVIRFNSDYRYADGWTGRYLRRLFLQNGFKEVRVEGVSHCDTEHGSYLHQMACRIAESAAEKAVLSKAECKTWLAELDKIMQEGNFFSSICFFSCQGVVSS